MTNLMNIMYHHTDAVEKLAKIQTGSDKQLVESMQQIKDLAAGQDSKAQELVDLKAVAQVVVEMVEESEAGDKILVARLREAPKKIIGFLSYTSRQYLAHALGLVKSFWPAANLALIGDGLAEGCSDEKFTEYVEEVKPIADKIISSLEQPSDGEV